MSTEDEIRACHGDFWAKLEKLLLICGVKPPQPGDMLVYCEPAIEKAIQKVKFMRRKVVVTNDTEDTVTFNWKGAWYITKPGEGIDPAAFPEPAEVLRAILGNKRDD